LIAEIINSENIVVWGRRYLNYTFQGIPKPNPRHQQEERKMYYGNDWGPSGTYSRDADGKWIWRYNKNDGHGGHGPEHRREME
jgi:hypothetical protein